jgi:TPR repeat protein
MYWNDIGHKDAKKWLCRSADSGYAEAQYRLGLLYENGCEGVPKDRVMAFMWYRLSASSEIDMRFVDNALRVYQELTHEQAAAADLLVQDWKPGQCEHNLLPVGTGQ